MSFEVRADLRSLPVLRARRHARVEVRAPERRATRKRPPLRLGLVLDHSGSMHGSKLALTQEAACQALRTLDSSDRFSVVAYNDRVRVLSPATAVSVDAVARAETALRSLHAHGTTDLSAGWLHGCAQIAEHPHDDAALARCLLLSDGLANRGITSVDALVHHAGELRARGVTTSTLGVGDNFDEALLHRIADAGGGHFYYARTATEIPSLVEAEVGRALETVAREARLWIHCDADVHIASLNGDPCFRDGDGHRVEIGSLRSGESRTSVLALDFDAGAIGTVVHARFAVSDLDEALRGEERAVSWTRVSSTECESEAPDIEVVHEVARVETARTRVRALDEHRNGNYLAALHCVDEQIQRLRRDAGDDPVLLELARELERTRAQYGRPMRAATGKGLRYSAYRSIKGGFDPLETVAPAPAAIGLRWLEPELAPVIERARQALAPHATAAGIELVAAPASDALAPPAALDPTREAQIASALSDPRGRALTAAFTFSRLHDNWFSHWHPAQRLVLVSLADWREMSAIPPVALVAYEGLLHGLRLMSSEYEPFRIMHNEMRGCLFDFCKQKAEVEVKLQAGHICSQCMSRLSHLGLDPALVGYAWSEVQQLAYVGPASLKI